MAISRQDGTIHLTGALRHGDAAALVAAIGERRGHAPIRIVDAGVSEAAFSVLQVLLSATVSVRESGQSLDLDLPATSALHTAAAWLGLALPATPAP